MSDKVRNSSRIRRKRSIRKRLSGTTERPRLSVFRSCKHIYAQVIDDTTGSTLAAASTKSPELRDQLAGKNKTEHAALVGALIAQKTLAAEISQVVFDRNGFIYHGRVKAVADGAREGGLQF
ncbi:MAG: 50S ribosomal protein L18 [Deltaproteobacteria bacterium]|nr:50S ribosomal protein L18 [Deltaproteobacteria bacterium]